MRNNIEQTKKEIVRAETFLAKYGDQLQKAARGHLWASDSGVHLTGYETEAALYGEIFGKSGWTRKLSGYSSPRFDWIKEVDGVKISIQDAEQFDMDNTPVPEKAFPLMLEEWK